jgi:hypothetical protein
MFAAFVRYAGANHLRNGVLGHLCDDIKQLHYTDHPPPIISPLNIYAHIHPASLHSYLIMQSDRGSHSTSRHSSASPHSLTPTAEEFSITKDDTGILEGYLDEFEEGDADLRNTVVAAALGELFMLRPDGIPFDKNDASKVCFHVQRPAVL